MQWPSKAAKIAVRPWVHVPVYHSKVVVICTYYNIGVARGFPGSRNHPQDVVPDNPSSWVYVLGVTSSELQKTGGSEIAYQPEGGLVTSGCPCPSPSA